MNHIIVLGRWWAGVLVRGWRLKMQPLQWERAGRETRRQQCRKGASKPLTRELYYVTSADLGLAASAHRIDRDVPKI